MTEPNHGTKVTCPHCHRSGTAKTSIPEGTKIKCPACGEIYQYQAIYSLEEPSTPASAPITPPDPPSIPRPATPAAWVPASNGSPPPLCRPAKRSVTTPLIRLPGWISIATGFLQFIMTVGGIILGTSGAYLSAHSEEQRLLADQQRLKGEMTKLTQHMQQLIQQCKLHVAIPPAIIPQQKPQVQPPQQTC